VAGRRPVIRCRLGPRLPTQKKPPTRSLSISSCPASPAEDLNPKLRDNKLRISGEVKDREDTGVLGRRGRQVGDFEYLVALPGQVDPNKVEAKLSDGVLTEPPRKSSPDTPRRIEITS
jgi:HSP20 family protein